MDSQKVAEDVTKSIADRVRAIKSLPANDPAIYRLLSSKDQPIRVAAACAFASLARARAGYPLGGGAT